MKKIMGLFLAIIFSNCASINQNDFSEYNFSVKNSLSIFLLNNEKGYFFCIPVQYAGDFEITRFEFTSGTILIGDYTILLDRNEVTIFMYLNETADETNQYDIYIEKYLTDYDLKNIINEYERGNTYSSLSIWFDITIDNVEQNGNGMLDDFELYRGPVNEFIWLLPHFEFFRVKYLSPAPPPVF